MTHEVPQLNLHNHPCLLLPRSFVLLLRLTLSRCLCRTFLGHRGLLSFHLWYLVLEIWKYSVLQPIKLRKPREKNITQTRKLRTVSNTLLIFIKIIRTRGFILAKETSHNDLELPPVVLVRVEVAGDHHAIGELPPCERKLSGLTITATGELYEDLAQARNLNSGHGSWNFQALYLAKLGTLLSDILQYIFIFFL